MQTWYASVSYVICITVLKYVLLTVNPKPIDVPLSSASLKKLRS